MAARRLLAVMLVFLVISTVLAALAPQPTEDEREATTEETTTPPAAGDQSGNGELLRRRVRLRATDSRLRAQPDHINIRPGDQLALAVSVPAVTTLEIPSLGLTRTAAPNAPARFDLFASAPGRHVLVEATTARPLVTIRVRQASADARQ